VAGGGSEMTVGIDRDNIFELDEGHTARRYQ
jgi:hypothetical protein